MLTIVTGSERKYTDISATLAPIETEWLKLDLDEIQSLDPRVVIEHKLQKAHLKLPGKEFLLDDRSLAIQGLGGLPGTFVKWFMEAVGPEGIQNMALTSSSAKAEARSFIGFCEADGKHHFFEGITSGRMVPARGNLDYDWGSSFQPDGTSNTYGEMEREEKTKWTHYAKALTKFKEFYLARKS